MRFDSGNLAIVVAILSAGCAVGCIVALRKLRKSLAAQQQEMSRQLAELAARLTQPAPASKQQDEVSLVAACEEPVPIEAVCHEDPETLAAITAAIAGFFGRKARIRSLRPVPAEPETVSAWSQQGRVFVQSSHNFNPHR